MDREELQFTILLHQLCSEYMTQHGLSPMSVMGSLDLAKYSVEDAFINGVDNSKHDGSDFKIDGGDLK